MLILKFIKPAIIATLVIMVASPAVAGTLENMERERAIMLEAVLSGDISVVERQRTLMIASSRLADLERMVLRDDSLIGRDQPAIRKAFENYDLTFIIHASSEYNRSLADHWFSELGLTTQAVMNARSGRR